MRERFPCIGGPKDGETLSALDLPWESRVTHVLPSRTIEVRHSEYVSAWIGGRQVWRWHDVRTVDERSD